MILIPLRHENMRGRRWPVITFALIAINIIAFLATHWTIEAQDEQIPQRIEVREHLMILAAIHPELNPGADAAEFVKTAKLDYPEDWKEAKNPDREPVDAWEANIRTVDEPSELQAEMNSLSQRFTSLEHTLLSHYGFVPAHPSGISYLTANFLHGGWLHLIGNMWFLWLDSFSRTIGAGPSTPFSTCLQAQWLCKFMAGFIPTAAGLHLGLPALWRP